MFTEIDLTEFQKTCERDLHSALISVGRHLVGRFIDGKDEPYIHAHVSDSDIELWIYKDGANYKGGHLRGRKLFEKLDFASEQVLMETFVKTIVAECV